MCKWTCCDEGNTLDRIPIHQYETECKDYLTIEGSVNYNKYKYCPFCKGQITIL